MSFRIFIAVLIFCLKDLSIDVSGVLKSLTINLFLLISSFMSFSICFIYLGVPECGVIMLTIVVSSCIDPFFVIQFPYLSLQPLFQFILFGMSIASPAFLFVCMKYLFPPFHLPSTYVLCPKVGLFQAAYWRFLLFFFFKFNLPFSVF